MARPSDEFRTRARLRSVQWQVSVEKSTDSVRKRRSDIANVHVEFVA
jgi:hypothetical protein